MTNSRVSRGALRASAGEAKPGPDGTAARPRVGPRAAAAAVCRKSRRFIVVPPLVGAGPASFRQVPHLIKVFRESQRGGCNVRSTSALHARGRGADLDSR